MLQLSEWLPNPIGKDTGQEWVELFNPGSAAVNLTGWKIRTANGKTAALSGAVNPGEYKILKPALTLRNTDETLALISPDGVVAGSSSFRGAAEEGRSVNNGRISFFGEPTPGRANVLRESSFINDSHSFDVPLNHSSGAVVFWGGMLGTALTLSLAFLYIVKQSDDLSELFFGGN